MPNLLDIATLSFRKNRLVTTQEKIKREGSPYYSWIVPVIAPAAVAYIEVATQFPLSRKYQPLDWLEIVNNDAVNLLLAVNTAEILPVPAGVIRKVADMGIISVTVTNMGIINSVLNSIVVTLQKRPLTVDKWQKDFSSR